MKQISEMLVEVNKANDRAEGVKEGVITVQE